MSLIKSLVLLVVFGFSNAAIPQLYCTTSTVENQCYLKDVYVTAPRYNIRSPIIHVTNVTTVAASGHLSVLSPDICEAFPRLRGLYITAGVEIIDQDALTSCYHIEVLSLIDNKIQLLPPNLFKNALRLHNIDLHGNLIGSIADNQFETNINLQNLYLEGNRVNGFPVSAVRNSANLQVLFLHSNSIIEFDADMVVETLPHLGIIAINGNILACSRVQGIMETLSGAGVSFYEAYNPDREFPYKMSDVEGVTCVEGQ